MMHEFIMDVSMMFVSLMHLSMMHGLRWRKARLHPGKNSTRPRGKKWNNYSQISIGNGQIYQGLAVFSLSVFKSSYLKLSELSDLWKIPRERIQFRRKQIGEREKFNEKQRLEMEEFQRGAQIRQVLDWDDCIHNLVRTKILNKNTIWSGPGIDESPKSKIESRKRNLKCLSRFLRVGWVGLGGTTGTGPQWPALGTVLWPPWSRRRFYG